MFAGEQFINHPAVIPYDIRTLGSPYNKVVLRVSAEGDDAVVAQIVWRGIIARISMESAGAKVDFIQSAAHITHEQLVTVDIDKVDNGPGKRQVAERTAIERIVLGIEYR